MDDARFVVANDEDNILRIYDSRKGGEPLQQIDISKYFSNNPKEREIDIEGATWFHGKILWITSHSNNSEGKLRSERYQIFLTEVISEGDGITLKVVGVPHIKLINDLKSSEVLKKYHFEAAEKLAPEKEGGINIEGLTSTPENKLLVGFRSPLIDGKALLIKIGNPAAVLDGKGAVVEDVIELNLGNQGVRSIEYSETTKSYFISAGPFNDDGTFDIYSWSGQIADQPKLVKIPELEGMNPEALLPHSGKMLVLSDDGGVAFAEDTICKNSEVSKRSFRGIWVALTN